MDEKSLNKILGAIGISAGVVTVLILGGLAVMAYKNYVDIQLAKLQIVKIKKELNIT